VVRLPAGPAGSRLRAGPRAVWKTALDVSRLATLRPDRRRPSSRCRRPSFRSRRRPSHWSRHRRSRPCCRPRDHRRRRYVRRCAPYRPARLVLLLRAALLRAAQPLGRCGRAEVGAAIAPARPRRSAETSAAWTRSTKPSTRAWPAEAAAGAPSTKPTATTAKAAAAWTRAAEAATRWTRAEPAWTWWRTVLARPRFAHRKVATHERLRVELVDDLLGDVPLGKFNERKSTRTSGFAIDRHDDVRGLGDRREVRSEIRFGCAVREVPYEETDSHGLW
jgi:hypothetical protein